MLRLIWVFEYIQHLAVLYVEQDFLETNSVIVEKWFALLGVPDEPLHERGPAPFVPNAISILASPAGSAHLARPC